MTPVPGVGLGGHRVVWVGGSCCATATKPRLVRLQDGDNKVHRHPRMLQAGPRTLKIFPASFDKGNDAGCNVMVLVVIGDCEVEDGQVEGVDPVEVFPDHRLLRALGVVAENADELEEPVAQQQLRRQAVRLGPDALLMKPLTATVALKHLAVPVARLTAVTVPFFVVPLVIVVPKQAVELVGQRLSRLKDVVWRLFVDVVEFTVRLFKAACTVCSIRADSTPRPQFGLLEGAWAAAAAVGLGLSSLGLRQWGSGRRQGFHFFLHFFAAICLTVHSSYT